MPTTANRKGNYSLIFVGVEIYNLRGINLDFFLSTHVFRSEFNERHFVYVLSLCTGAVAVSDETALFYWFAPTVAIALSADIDLTDHRLALRPPTCHTSDGQRTSPTWTGHPTPLRGDKERSETFTHMAGWAVRVDLAACFLSSETWFMQILDRTGVCT